MSAVETGLARTPLHDLHLELGARMVPFAGYSMPVQYPAGVLKEHQHTRMAAGLFDVSHMGQVRLDGAQAAAALETLVPVDVLGLPAGRQRYAVFTNDAGGILDDLMIVNAGDHLFLVVNAACKAQDLAHLRARLEPAVTVTELADRALLALQGPAAAEVFLRLAPAAAGMKFMDFRTLEVAGIPGFASRSGYTGEDGFEISVPAARAVELARALLAEPEVAPIGLGARDSLRLEAGLCLYGHDIDRTTTPVEAGLLWSISKRRRQEGGFPGDERVRLQIAHGPSRKRVGIKPEGKAPAREGTDILTVGGELIGKITSGGYGPSVGGPVAMGYVTAANAKADTPVRAMVRGQALPARVAALPFAPHRYHRS
ncbi:MAG TPA: glycine cleavage system aminomethyltransferase GcvT [Plasticicumulans sp.]|nr:glycine cleavage system aminomethyltransferase GcvT [Plasticicumulans sp.]